ncbi:MAG TPA: histidine kinase [Longimicrobium sp.]|nr:histidine kinase [Longimicrobium sp.]
MKASAAPPAPPGAPAGPRWLGGRLLLAMSMFATLEFIYVQWNGSGLTWENVDGFLTNVIISSSIAVVIFWGTARWPLWGNRWRPAHPLVHLGIGGGAVLFLVSTHRLFSHLTGGAPQEPLELILRLTPSTLLVYAMASAVGTGFATRDEWTEAALRRTNLAAQLHQAQLSVLRSQLHPHFLFNTLNAIAELVHNDRDGAVRVVAQLGSLLRYSMDASGETEVPLRVEMAALEAYLDIVRVRFGDRAAIRAEVDPAALDARVPPLLLQPLVENAVKHGFERMEGPGWLEVTGRVEGNRLQLRVANGGTGLMAAGDGRVGIGIRNTRARLEQLYGDRAELTLHARDGEPFTAMVTLPAR